MPQQPSQTSGASGPTTDEGQRTRYSVGQNKRVCARIEGEIRVVDEHLKRIAAEQQRPQPDRHRIAKREKDIARHTRISILSRPEGRLQRSQHSTRQRRFSSTALREPVRNALRAAFGTAS